MRLLPVATICRFLGKDPNDGEHLIESGLPIVRIPGEAKNTPRVVPASFIKWISSRLGGTARSEDVERDLRDFLVELAANDGRSNRTQKSKGGREA